MPTLLTEGAIVIQNWMTAVQKRKAKYQISLDFLLDFISDRTPPRRKQNPKIIPKSIGDKVILLKSGTGSGKSTTIPPGLYDRFYDNLKKDIGITQPTRLTTQLIPYDILQYNKHLRMEYNIGYQTGIISKKPINGILFMTVGILLQHFKTLTDEQLMNKYSFIIIDEVHNRDENVDLTLFLIKRFLQRNYDNPNCPIIILMSATFEKKSYMEYFNIPKTNYIEVIGQSHKKTLHYENNAVNNWKERVIEIIKEIHTSPEGIEEIKNKNTIRDILIFVSSKKEIESLLLKIHKLNLDKTFVEYGYISPISMDSLTFSRGGKMYQNMFSPIDTIREKLLKSTQEGEINWSDIEVNVVRRVIVSTPTLETGVTIDTLKYCIETGFVINIEFNPTFGVNTILRKNVTQGASEQRIGRVGRKAPGIAYLLYTKEMFNSFMKDQYPQLLTSEFTYNLLSSIITETNTTLENTDINDEDAIFIHSTTVKYKIVYEKPFNVLDLDFLSYPSSDSIRFGLEKLYMLGFINQLGSTLSPNKPTGNGEIIPTMLGLLANKIRFMKIENIRMVFAGYFYGCNILDLITIASFLQLGWRSISSKTRSKFKPLNILNAKTDEEASLFQHIIIGDDFIEYLFIWSEFMKQLDKHKGKKFNNIIKWVEDNNLLYDGLIEVVSLRDIYIESFISNGLNPYYNGLSLKKGSFNLIDILNKNINEGINEIIKIKKCIYEGYRMNTATYNSISQIYIMDWKKVPIIVSSNVIKPLPMIKTIKQTVPRKIIVDEVTLGTNPMNPKLYCYFGGAVSVMDGFIDDIDDVIIENYP